MSRTVFAAVLFTVMTASANAACVPSDVVVVDRSLFKPTIDNARAALSDIDFQSEAEVYNGGKLKAFADQVAKRKPKVVVMHYSMFRAGNDDRGKVLSLFVEQLEKQSPAPLKYVIYSSSLADPVYNKGGNTKEIFKTRKFFKGVSYDKIELVFVKEKGRFVECNGEPRLKALFRGFKATLCGQ